MAAASAGRSFVHWTSIHEAGAATLPSRRCGRSWARRRTLTRRVGSARYTAYLASGCSTVLIEKILPVVESRMAIPKPAQPPEPAHIRVLPDSTVTLPADVVHAAGFAEGETIAVSLESGGLRLDPAGRSATALRKQPLRDLYEYFAPVREEVRESGISEVELNELIDEAIAASRRERSRSSE